MDFTKQVVVINPMSSCRPTGLGVAGEGLLNYFPECRDRFSDKIYRIINDRIKSGLLRIVFRQMATEFFAWRHRRKLLICSTHQGALLRHGCSVVFIHDFTTLRRPFQNRAQVMGFLRGACESNESCFVRTAKAVALAQIVRIPLTDDSVEERFVLAMDGGKEQAANLYHHLYQFCVNAGCDCYVISRHSDVGNNRIETRMGTVQTYPLHFIHIPLPTIPGM